MSMVVFWMLCLFSSGTFADDVIVPDINGILSQPAIWTDDQGQQVQLRQFKGQSLVIAMIYTQCRKVCPSLTIAKLKDIHEQLKQRQVRAEFVVATFDPENDTAEVLAAFKKRMHLEDNNWHLLRGTEKDTRRLATSLGLGHYFAMDEHIVHDFRIVFWDATSAQMRILNREFPAVERLLSGTPGSL